MEPVWTFEHFSFELIVQVLSILISVSIGWLIWKAQFKVTKEDVEGQRSIEDSKRLQILLKQCLLTVSDNKGILKESLLFQIYSAAPYEIKSWVAGLQYALKRDAISGALNSGLIEKLPSKVEKTLIEVRLKVFEIQKDLASSETKFEFYASNKTYESNARSDWGNLKRDFESCINSLYSLEKLFIKKENRVELTDECKREIT